MRITTWNCQMGFGRKSTALFAHHPDVAVITECSKHSVLSLSPHGYCGAWGGLDPKKKGVGLIARLGFQISEPLKSEYRWVVPFQVSGGTESVKVVAIWACKVGDRKRDNYIGQVYGALKRHPEWFSNGPTVVAGDFNSNAIWDRERPHGNHS